jgi:hypothetical protein
VAAPFGRDLNRCLQSIVDPDGRVPARRGIRSGLALAQIDARRATATAREGLSHLQDRRPAAYAPAPSSLAPA